ncbi:NAD-dependent epimerase/dehydratase family protein [Streptomyces sp. NP160]|uniref:NAD-dependent epimerase/dehydratase family protein n=1 Tax=Streptomyces sp. NP160 TaxID=2586637 RepID=UPI0015D5F7EA|nr:NAD-dependent epimerase/dehydratase family protein [Streptomyces sp. NP160]
MTGSAGLLGSALRSVVARGGGALEVVFATRSDADLSDPRATRDLLGRTRPDVIVHGAARVGGIKANAADQTGFLLDNLAIDTSLFRAALDAGVERLVYLGSSCTYPRDHRQPLVETDLLQAPLEPTNEGYALAKLAGTRLCQFASAQHGVAYRALVASNLYGPGDDFSTDRAHLVAAAIAKVHAAKVAGSPTVTIWGDGTARREFTYAGDVASWILGSLPRLELLPPVLNLGAGVDHSVTEYYEVARSVVGYEGEFVYDTSMPKGMHQKLMDSSRARALGWAPATSLADGMLATYEKYVGSLVPA